LDREIQTILETSLSQMTSIDKQIEQIEQSTVCFACGRPKDTDEQSITHTKKLIEDLKLQQEEIANNKTIKKRNKEIEKEKAAIDKTILDFQTSLVEKDTEIIDIKNLITEKESLFLENHTENNQRLTKYQNLQKKTRIS